jgi:hypothetical protein
MMLVVHFCFTVVFDDRVFVFCFCFCFCFFFFFFFFFFFAEKSLVARHRSRLFTENGPLHVNETTGQVYQEPVCVEPKGESALRRQPGRHRVQSYADYTQDMVTDEEEVAETAHSIHA